MTGLAPSSVHHPVLHEWPRRVVARAHGPTRGLHQPLVTVGDASRARPPQPAVVPEPTAPILRLGPSCCRSRRRRFRLWMPAAPPWCPELLATARPPGACGVADPSSRPPPRRLGRSGAMVGTSGAGSALSAPAAVGRDTPTTADVASTRRTITPRPTSARRLAAGASFGPTLGRAVPTVIAVVVSRYQMETVSSRRRPSETKVVTIGPSTAPTGSVGRGGTPRRAAAAPRARTRLAARTAGGMRPHGVTATELA